MIKYFKSFKEYIPTWVICIFMFFWIFGWTFFVGMILFIIQCFQVKKIKAEIKDIKRDEIKNDYFEENIIRIENDNHEAFQEKLASYELNIKTMQEEISILNNLIKEKDNNISKFSLEISKLNDLVKNKENDINVLSLENKKVKNENSQLQKEIVKNKNNEQKAELERNIEKLNTIIKEKQEKITALYSKINNLNKGTNEIDPKKFVLSAGKYKGGIDIPVGIYNVNLISGFGTLETDEPENIYLKMSNDKIEQADYGRIGKYSNLEISEKTILKIKESAEIEFLLSKKYDFAREFEEIKQEYENEKNILNRELENIKKELLILNNELIKNYYEFSDYSKITSQDCKDKLILLKQKEKNLRQKEKDVVIQRRSTRTRKTEESIIRQMLRTFNAECDNILLNISSKNIDSSKRQIEKSFETINKLYLVDSASLDKELLKLKLEQATLMYTYELKYQQEKEIQKAIKDKMVEEAKAQKEIEEQKKKIDKDLQQYVGEVNKLIKYLQKTQNDVEKELYADKIRELEEKIKQLESEKKNVIQREANAKAGFVYIISNIGSFGENIYKIGMTRRLEPMDRIKELSSASVPFEFDVHAMIFSDDAPYLENELHKYFAEKAVNKVNPRKEFYNVDIEEIEKVVKEKYNDTVQFTKIPLATEYRQSISK